MVRAVVLDFDGVVLDSVGIKTKAFARLFEDKGPAVVRQVVNYHLANGGISRFRKFAHIYTNILGEPLSEEESNRLGDRFSALAFDEIVKAAWIPGAPEFLRNYYQRYLLFVASGTPHEELQQILRQRGIEQYFIGAFGSPMTKAEIVSNIIAENRLEKAETLFVGDAMTDFQAAMESGVGFIGIARDSTSPIVLPDLRNLVEAITVTKV
jgi:HAD superfamily hydrolase (TIGR01549 family)